MKSIRRRRSWPVFVVAAVLLGPVFGCGGGSSTSADRDGCTTPVRGSRYGVCGDITTGAISTGTRATVAGSTDAVPGDTAGRYTILGGTFHAHP
jgi:hypothetical protein